MRSALAYVDSPLFFQFQPLTQLDWCSILDADEVELVVAQVVMRELETKKHGENRRLRKRATAALEMILKCVGSETYGELREHVRLRVDPVDPTIDFLEVGLNGNVADDWLIARLIERAPESPTLITDDAGLLLKVRGRTIPHLRPPESARLPPEEDEEIKKLTEENRALKRELAKRHQLALTFCDETTLMRPKVGWSAPLSARDFAERVDARRSELLEQVALAKSSRGAFRVPGPPLDPTELDTYLAQWAEYDRAKQAQTALLLRSTAVTLRLFNGGNAPASGIEVHLKLPPEVQFGCDMEGPDEPEEPMLPPFFDPFGFRRPSLEGRVARLVGAWRRDDGRWKQNTNTLRASRDELMHKRDLQLRPFWVAFPTRNSQLVGFEIEFTVLVARPADEIVGKLHLVPELLS